MTLFKKTAKKEATTKLKVVATKKEPVTKFSKKASEVFKNFKGKQKT